MLRITFTSALIASALASVALATPETPVTKAMDAFKAGEYAETLALAGAVAEDAEEYPRAQYLVGETQLLLHDFPAAERAFLHVLDRRPEAIPALVGLGRSLSYQGHPKEAEIHLRAAVELDEKDLAAQRTLGEVLLQAQRANEAAPWIRGAYEADPKHPLNVRALVVLLVSQGENADAGTAARELAVAREEHPMGPFLLGVVHEREGKEEDAIAAYQAALQRDDRFLDAHKNLAILCHTLSNTYQIQERNDLALAHYERYFALGGRDESLEQMYRTLKTFLAQAPR